jgi:hypothetical protein
MKKYRFFFHYHKNKKLASVHFRGKCYLVSPPNLKCMVPCEGKENTKQPYFVMQGFAQNLKIKNNIIIIT